MPHCEHDIKVLCGHMACSMMGETLSPHIHTLQDGPLLSLLGVPQCSALLLQGRERGKMFTLEWTKEHPQV